MERRKRYIVNLNVGGLQEEKRRHELFILMCVGGLETMANIHEIVSKKSNREIDSTDFNNGQETESYSNLNPENDMVGMYRYELGQCRKRRYLSSDSDPHTNLGLRKFR